VRVRVPHTGEEPRLRFHGLRAQVKQYEQHTDEQWTATSLQFGWACAESCCDQSLRRIWRRSAIGPDLLRSGGRLREPFAPPRFGWMDLAFPPGYCPRQGLDFRVSMTHTSSSLASTVRSFDPFVAPPSAEDSKNCDGGLLFSPRSLGDEPPLPLPVMDGSAGTSVCRSLALLLAVGTTYYGTLRN
jgi:hypothetical protein